VAPNIDPPVDLLFTALRVGKLWLPNRIIMAPMTRGRATPDGVPLPRMATYYAQRASAGLLITEAVIISPQAGGWIQAPKIYTPAHVEAWRHVTDAVKARGGRIFAQLWFVGRVSHPDFIEGRIPFAPSALKANHYVHTPRGKKECVTPQAMTLEDIRGVEREFSEAAQHAIDAGFDGVQIHAASGYLPDQFLRDYTNRRTDRYGGSIGNRLRFLRETVEGCVRAVGADRVAVRLSTRNKYNDIDDSDPVATFAAAAGAMGEYDLAFLDVMEPLPGHFIHVPGEPILPIIRATFKGPLFTNGGYDRDSAERVIAAGEADAVSFGVPYVGNPDLVERMRAGATLNASDPETFYVGEDRGYADYPTMNEGPSPLGAHRALSLAEASRH
jgi:N-ethylmaleimide reductase